MSDSRELLRVEGLSKSYGTFVAVQTADLRVGVGEVVGLVGKNGAGKSTLIKCVAGIVRRDVGRISVDGTEVSLSTPAQARDLGLAFLHQDLNDVPAMSITENIWLGHRLPRRFGVVDVRAMRERAESMLQLVGLDIDPSAEMASLSVATRQMVMLARAVGWDARLVVMDEPTSALSAREVDRLAEVIARISADSTSVLYVSHRLQEVLDYCSRVTVMRDGRVVADEVTAGLSKHELVERITGKEGVDAAVRRSLHHVPLADTVEPLLKAEALSALPAVRHASLAVRSGEILGLAGLVGSGRTELARLLAGADEPSAGSLTVDGNEVRFGSPTDAISSGVTMLPEDRRGLGFIGGYTVRENLTLASLSAHRLLALVPMPSRRKEQVTANDIIERLSIATTGSEQLVTRLSGGNQQKVVLGRWLVHGARVLIFDEPTQGVDVEAKEEIFREVEELAASGAAVIFISSEFEELVRICDRVIVMSEGRTTVEFAGDQIGESTLLAACYEEDVDVDPR